jgi:Permease for cytosine/purines, uracil, thiamine, allantoin
MLRRTWTRRAFNSWVAKVQRFAGKFHIEQRGIERVPEDERTGIHGALNVGTMWLAANMVVSSFAIGALATPVFGLGFVDTILTVFFVNVLGILPVCFFSTFGLVFGFRQMVLSRYFFRILWGEVQYVLHFSWPVLPLRCRNDSCNLQHPFVHRVVLCEHDRWRAAFTRRERKFAWLWWYTHHRHRDLPRHSLWVQDRARV